MDPTDLQTAYVPTAVYYEDADSVEYVRRDVPSIQRRIDGLLTLVLDMESREVIGFRIKGFRNFFLTELKPTFGLLDSDFVPLVLVIVAALKHAGDKLFDDVDRQRAYGKAFKIAREDHADLHYAQAA